MSLSPKRPSKYKASHQAQPSDHKNGSHLFESNQEAIDSPIHTPSPQIGDTAESSSTLIPSLNRPPSRPLAQSTSQPDSEPASELSVSISDSDQDIEVERQQPIPPPSEPMQYRAIGLVQGQYIPSEQQFNRGVLLTTDGTLLDAVLLGRVMSLVKKHLNLDQEHLWVVYPRTREKHSSLHIQILGVWEPALNPDQLPLSDLGDSSGETRLVSDGYFSIRGEVIYQAEDKGYVVIKVNQAPRRGSEDGKSFKLRLEGVLPPKALGYFWSLDARRHENTLVIEQSHSIALIPPQKKGQRKPRARSNQRRDLPESTHSPSTKPLFPNQAMRREPVGKPIKRNTTRTDDD